MLKIIYSGSYTFNSGLPTAQNNPLLYTTYFAPSGESTKAFINGTEKLSVLSGGSGRSFRYIGRGDNEQNGLIKLSEVIYYPSDQSANRPAIEANINNQYDIY